MATFGGAPSAALADGEERFFEAVELEPEVEVGLAVVPAVFVFVVAAFSIADGEIVAGPSTASGCWRVTSAALAGGVGEPASEDDEAGSAVLSLRSSGDMVRFEMGRGKKV